MIIIQLNKGHLIENSSFPFQVFGNQLIPPNAQVKRATVFLNPAACKGYFSL